MPQQDFNRATAQLAGKLKEIVRVPGGLERIAAHLIRMEIIAEDALAFDVAISPNDALELSYPVLVVHVANVVEALHG